MLATIEIISYFWPHTKNNHRPKLIKSTSFLIMSIAVLCWELMVFVLIPRTDLKILGYASSISVDEVVRLTNDKRVEAGVAPLAIDSQLSQAAKEKGEHMLANDYWAHTAPDGTEPWVFFKSVGYTYRYAGENLARDFSNPQSAVEAWLASPTHKENLLAEKYHDIGIAVVEGDLAGVDTTIIVQLFGTRTSSTPQIAPVAQAKESETIGVAQNAAPLVTETENKPQAATISEEQEVNKPTLTSLPTTIQNANEAGASSQVLISPFATTRQISLITVILLISVFIIDAIAVSKSRISRISGRSLAHISFMGMILAIIIILKAGKIV